MPKFSIVVRPYKCSARPNAKWVLNVWYPTGKRQRRYFETKEAAQDSGERPERDAGDARLPASR